MIIHLDTSVLIDALQTGGATTQQLRLLATQGHRLTFCTLVLYEWQRGPRTEIELTLQSTLFPVSQLVPFGVDTAGIAANIYRRVARPRARGADLAIAACAIERRAALWTLNVADFEDIPDLMLHRP